MDIPERIIKKIYLEGFCCGAVEALKGMSDLTGGALRNWEESASKRYLEEKIDAMEKS